MSLHTRSAPLNYGSRAACLMRDSLVSVHVLFSPSLSPLDTARFDLRESTHAREYEAGRGARRATVT